ncbi:MAG: hypothetical protein ACLRWQ_05705 [Flavonifractor plautii]
MPSWQPSPGAYLEGTDLTGTAQAGLAASAIAMEGAETINPAMSAEAAEAAGWGALRSPRPAAISNSA